jgi:hypothetical protein
MPKIKFKPIFAAQPDSVVVESGQFVVSPDGIWVDLDDGRVDVLQSVRTESLTETEVEDILTTAGIITL